MKTFYFTYTTLTPKTAELKTQQSIFHAKDEAHAQLHAESFIKLSLGHFYHPDIVEIEYSLNQNLYGVVVLPKEVPQRITVISGEIHEYTGTEALSTPEADPAVTLKNGNGLPKV